MARHKELQVANDKLERMLAGLQALHNSQQQKSAVLQSEKELALAELAEAAADINNLEDNIQVPFSFNPSGLAAHSVLCSLGHIHSCAGDNGTCQSGFVMAA